MGNIISRAWDKATGKHDAEQEKKAARAAAMALWAAQEDERKKKKALELAQEQSRDRRGGGARPTVPLGQNTILTGLLGLLGQAQGGAGPRTLLGG